MRSHSMTSIIALLAVLLVTAGCSSDRIEDSDGDVFLVVSDFNGLPLRASVNLAGQILQVGEIQISSFAKDPNAVTSELQGVELDTYEVSYSRADGGSRLPPILVEPQFGYIPPEGTITFENLRLMGVEQFDNPPISDLLFENGAFDKETGEQVITLNLSMRFFGRTVSGANLATEPIAFTVEFVP